MIQLRYFCQTLQVAQNSGVLQVQIVQRGVLLEDVQVSCDVGVFQVERRQGTELTELLGQGTVEITAGESDHCDVASIPGRDKRMDGARRRIAAEGCLWLNVF